MDAEVAARLEGVLRGAQRALRQLEAMEPHDATTAGAHALRRAVGAVLDAIDDREPTGPCIDRARADLSVALAIVTGGAPDDARPGLMPEEDVALAALREALEQLPVRPPSRLPSRAAHRALPPWRVSFGEPSLFDLPRRSLLPIGAVHLPAPPAPFDAEAWAAHTEALVKALEGGDEAPPAPFHGGLQEAAMLEQAADLERRVERITAQLPDVPVTPTPASSHGLDGELGAPPAQAPAGSPLPTRPVASEAQLRRRHARELYEEIGMCGWQRQPMWGDDWRELASLEQRLLAASDALLGYGPAALADLEAWARDAPAPEPMRVFAVAFVAGVLEGRDGLAAAERVLFAHDPEDSEVVDAFVGALVATPNPKNATALRALLNVEPWPVRAGAVKGLVRLDVLTLAEADRAAEDHPAVAAAAALALATSVHPHARARLEQLARRHGEDPRLDRALWQALAIAGHPDAARLPRSSLDAEQGSHTDAAALALALVADRDDARALRELVEREATPARLTALGWAGDLEGVPWLLGALEHDALWVSASRALWRLLGGDQFVAVDIDPEDLLLLEPAVSPPRVASPLDADDSGSPDQVVVPSRAVDHWSTRGLDATLRHRFGQPYLPAHSWQELGRSGVEPPTSPWGRQFLQRELAARTGHYVRWHGDDWVARQDRRIAQWEGYVQRATVPAGTFSRVIRRGAA